MNISILIRKFERIKSKIFTKASRLDKYFKTVKISFNNSKKSSTNFHSNTKPTTKALIYPPNYSQTSRNLLQTFLVLKVNKKTTKNRNFSFLQQHKLHLITKRKALRANDFTFGKHKNKIPYQKTFDMRERKREGESERMHECNRRRVGWAKACMTWNEMCRMGKFEKRFLLTSTRLLIISFFGRYFCVCYPGKKHQNWKGGKSMMTVWKFLRLFWCGLRLERANNI